MTRGEREYRDKVMACVEAVSDEVGVVMENAKTDVTDSARHATSFALLVLRQVAEGMEKRIAAVERNYHTLLTIELASRLLNWLR